SPREHWTQVFDPYFTTKPAGSGLGLATAYSIITRHGGMITVDSAVGVGTTFQIYLPISARPLQREARIESVAARGEGRILIMDDDDMIRNLASTMLRHLGYRSEMAADGEEAIRRYVEAIESGQRIDAVIIDLTIPGGMGGKETIQHLLKIDPNVKAIVSSGYSNDPIMADHEAYGFSGVMAKPYKMEDLGRVLKQVLSAPERNRFG
ncbi:MAG: response regulator, partial [Pedosphaera parvula]|nr:response regulator [Pedosphaera parvula]